MFYVISHQSIDLSAYLTYSWVILCIGINTFTQRRIINHANQLFLYFVDSAHV